MYVLAIPNGSIGQYHYIDEPFSHVETLQPINYSGWIHKHLLLDQRNWTG